MCNNKDESYYKNIRFDLLKLIPCEKEKYKMLEVGAGYGNTLIYAKKHYGAYEVYGVDIVDVYKKNPDKDLIDGFIVEDIMKKRLDDFFDKEMFDIIVFADVLEHLYDPEEILRYSLEFLKKDGIILASIPNFMYFKNLYRVFVKGDFLYEESGILDKTHIRFFCRKNIINLFEKVGLKIKHISGENKNALKRILYKIPLVKDYCIYQFLIVAERK